MNTKAYQRGRAAYGRNQSPRANPYHMATDAQAAHYREWLRGWRDAVRNDPLLDEDEKDALICADS